MRQSSRPLVRPDERLQPLIRSLRIYHNRPINKTAKFGMGRAASTVTSYRRARVSSLMAVEEVISLVRHKRLFADVRQATAAFRGRRSSHGIYSLNEGGPCQLGAARWSR